MTETTITLSVATQTSVQGLTRAKHEVTQWAHNLERALADDVDAARLTLEEAAEIAKANLVQAPPPPGDKAEAKETTAEANQAQLDAQTKVAQAEAAKTAAPPHHPNQERENRERAEHERRVEHEAAEAKKRAEHEAAEAKAETAAKQRR